MSTHTRRCVICGENAYCCNDTHALGCGGGCHDPENEAIEFCSLECALDLQRRLAENIANYGLSATVMGAPTTAEDWVKYAWLALNDAEVARVIQEAQGLPEATTVGLWTYGYVEDSMHEKTAPKTCIGHTDLRSLLALRELRAGVPTPDGGRPQ